MAIHGYMSIKGRRQGLISSGCSAPESLGNRCQEGHLDEIMMLSFTHSLSNFGNTERITHRPVMITKYIDKATPLLSGALADREVLECRIKLYRLNPAGKIEQYFRVDLSDAMIVDQRIEVPHSVLLNNQDPQEYLAIRYGFVAWHHMIANTSGYASWGEES
ncbi:Hcp family type VI secretion system effector [Pseudomonas sp. S31]|uniref:Hcp family type VI secretion system effector n=1 Tax=Pseudomonas sp. S31 TaxID=1564473 RepID=UPI001912DDE2|nr:Hcp family type VI secretion system effector [Pseudomonas sp. S31]MBK5002847.1 Hcp family type VI secretion system effector [Pseudomonas sp. S31]